MKELFNYENRTGEMKKSLQVGAGCVGIVAGSLYKELKPIVEIRIKDEIHRRQRRGYLKDLIKSV